MRCIISTSTNPHYNLATEEYLLKSNNEEIFLLYINEPCIVVGKHQNLLSEINLPYVIENSIKLARRISGGGTVYQDLDNLNFSFIHNCSNFEQINFTKFTYPILEALREIGLDVVFSGRNDLLIDSKKISGNAMHIFKTRVLSHGTLLFDADLNHLSAALKNSPEKYIDKSIKSVRSKVDNISNHIESPKTINEFRQTLFDIITAKSDSSYTKPITEHEEELIKQISYSKFDTWEWVYGYSPKYLFQNNFRISNLSFNLDLQVEKGYIKSIKTNIFQTHNAKYQYIYEVLLNAKHEYHSIVEILKKDNKINSLKDFYIEEFCNSIF